MRKPNQPKLTPKEISDQGREKERAKRMDAFMQPLREAYKQKTQAR